MPNIVITNNSTNGVVISDPVFEDELAVYQEQNIAVYAASSLHFSLLGARFEHYRQHPGEDNEYITEMDVENAVRVNEIARKYNISLPTMAQRYLFSMEEATRVVIGARKISQIHHTIDDWKQGALSEPVFEEITDAII